MAADSAKKYNIDSVFLKTYRKFRKSGLKHTEALARTEELLQAPKEVNERRNKKRATKPGR